METDLCTGTLMPTTMLQVMTAATVRQPMLMRILHLRSYLRTIMGSSGAINYGQEARTLINNLYNHCVEHGSYVLKPGDRWGGSSVTNRHILRLHGTKCMLNIQETQDGIKWRTSVTKLLKKLRNTTTEPALFLTGVLQAELRQAVRVTTTNMMLHVTAGELPWTIHGLVTREQRQLRYADQILCQRRAKGIVDGYTIQGSKISNNHNASFIGPVAAASMTGYDLNFAKELYRETVAVKDSEYYGYYETA